MVETHIGELLLDLSILLGLSYLLAGLLLRVRIPAFLGALFIAMAAHYTPLGECMLSTPLYGIFSFLAQLGVLFLLFFVGLQIDLKEMRGMGSDIIWCTVLNSSAPFLLGMTVMLVLGYGWILAFVVGLTRMPTAEAVIVPILDEFRLIRTRVGQLIVGVGTLDDVFEVVLVSIVSILISKKVAIVAGGLASEILSIFFFLAIFIIVAWLGYRWLIPWLSRWLPRKQRHLMMLSVLVLFGLGGYTESSHLGMVIGALIAGVLMHPIFNSMGVVGEQTKNNFQAISYGFLGLVFFFWVGLSVDLGGILRNPTLTILLYLAGTLGKLLGVFLMVPMKRLTVREAWIVGVGLDARLTTEIIVAKLLLDAKLINGELFTALVTAASFTVITVPLIFTLLVRRWGEEMRMPPGELARKQTAHVSSNTFNPHLPEP